MEHGMSNRGQAVGIPTVDATLSRPALLRDAMAKVPEAFDADGHLLSPIAGRWESPALWTAALSPVDGRPIADLPRLPAERVTAAVEATAAEFDAWSARPVAERAAMVEAALDGVRAHRDLLVPLVAWEIGKTLAAAGTDVDRCIAGVAWYLERAEEMTHGRRPLGLVSNIASWNYPFSVLLQNVLVQALSGNAVIAKIPTQGGGIALTLAFGLLRRAGLPVTLVGGPGADLTEPLVGHRQVMAVAFVGGRANGGAVAKRLRGSSKRHALEMEGVNAYGITDFSDWASLAKQIRAGFEFGKQRCTAYTRWVVRRELVPSFVDAYVSAVSSIRVGHPLASAAVDFGPLISGKKVAELRAHVAEAVGQGARVLHEGALSEVFEPGQDRSAYLAPMLLEGVRAPSPLYLREPFGPVDLLVPVDSDDELVAEANVSRGALVGSIATDDVARGERLAARLEAFKVGVNRLRSRGDRDETFGGAGGSWQGAFVGGALLVRAFTDGDEPVLGNDVVAA